MIYRNTYTGIIVSYDGELIVCINNNEHSVWDNGETIKYSSELPSEWKPLTLEVYIKEIEK